MNDNDILHIYAQPFPHEEARIIGTRASLEKLQKALNATLASTQNKPIKQALVFTSDGEGYHVIVQIVSEEEMEKLPLPYTDFCK